MSDHFSNKLAVSRLEKALNISTASMGSPREEFTTEKLMAAINALNAQDEISKQYLIVLLGSMGFTVFVSPFLTKPTVILPDAYNDAIAAVKNKEGKNHD